MAMNRKWVPKGESDQETNGKWSAKNKNQLALESETPILL
jgi:hypothetical protein